VEDAPRKPIGVMKSWRRGTKRIMRDGVNERGCRGNGSPSGEAAALSASDFKPPVLSEIDDFNPQRCHRNSPWQSSQPLRLLRSRKDRSTSEYPPWLDERWRSSQVAPASVGISTCSEANHTRPFCRNDADGARNSFRGNVDLPIGFRGFRRVILKHDRV